MRRTLFKVFRDTITSDNAYRSDIKRRRAPKAARAIAKLDGGLPPTIDARFTITAAATKDSLADLLLRRTAGSIVTIIVPVAVDTRVARNAVYQTEISIVTAGFTGDGVDFVRVPTRGPVPGVVRGGTQSPVR